MRIVVIGAGGIGGWLIRALAPTLEYTNEIQPADKNLVVIDGDSFEPKNATRQDFEMLGPKPEVRCAEMAPRYPMVNFTPLHKWVVETAPSGEGEGDELGVITATDLIQDGDVVCCVVDNFATRAIVIDACSKLDNVDFFSAGNDDAYFGSYYHYQRRDGVDVTENPIWKDEFANPTDRNPGELSCEERAKIDGGTQLIWTNMAIAAMLGVKINRLIVQGVREDDTDEAFFDFEKCRAGGRDRTDIDFAKAQASDDAQQTADEISSDKVPVGTAS